jgi:hypothetical protein
MDFGALKHQELTRFLLATRAVHSAQLHRSSCCVVELLAVFRVAASEREMSVHIRRQEQPSNENSLERVHGQAIQKTLDPGRDWEIEIAADLASRIGNLTKQDRNESLRVREQAE